MRINHNIAALNAWRGLTQTDTNLGKSLEKLSSGLRINRAGDDAAGLAISEKMRAQIKGLDMASKNAQDGISLIQTAEGALNETHSILQRMRELAVQSASDTNTASDRAELQKEVDQLAQELTRIANNTEFNTQKLLNGGVSSGGLGAVTFQIGANENQTISLSIGALDAFTLGVARDTFTASVAAGATGITGASVDTVVGAAVVDGAAISVTTADNTGVEASGSLVVGSDTLTITADAVGTELNGVRFMFGTDNNDAVAVTWDANTRTFTIRADWDDSESGGGGGAPDYTDLTTAINTALGAAGFTGTVTIDDGGVAVADLAGGSVTMAGGAAANANETIVTFDDGTNTQTVVVADTATSVSVTTGAFRGLSFTTSDVTTASGTINIGTEAASAATFVNGETTDAVANAGVDISSQSAASSAISVIDNALAMVSSERAKLGAYQNRLEHTINNLGVASENLTAAESRIRDVDMAKEIMAFTKENILAQAGTAMLAQANMRPQSILQLLQ